MSTSSPSSTSSISMALFLAKCCRASYSDLCNPAEAFKQLGFDSTYYIAEYVPPEKQWLPMNDPIECVAYFSVNHTDRVCVLTFRGTGSWQDLKDDLRFIKLQTEDGWFIHKGFLKRYRALKTRVEQMIYANMPHGYRLYVTGHSLGHAMTVLFLLKASPELIDKVTGVYTFGGARVGGKKVAEAVDHLSYVFPFYRYVNQGDIITKLPMIGYYHCGNEIFLSRKLDKGRSWWHFVPSLSRTFKVLRPLYHHKIDTYINRLLVLNRQ